jgi:hypothetical protein
MSCKQDCNELLLRQVAWSYGNICASCNTLFELNMRCTVTLLVSIVCSCIPQHALFIALSCGCHCENASSVHSKLHTQCTFSSQLKEVVTGSVTIVPQHSRVAVQLRELGNDQYRTQHLHWYTGTLACYKELASTNTQLACGAEAHSEDTVNLKDSSAKP